MYIVDISQNENHPRKKYWTIVIDPVFYLMFSNKMCLFFSR